MVFAGEKQVCRGLPCQQDGAVACGIVARGSYGFQPGPVRQVTTRFEPSGNCIARGSNVFALEANRAGGKDRGGCLADSASLCPDGKVRNATFAIESQTQSHHTAATFRPRFTLQR